MVTATDPDSASDMITVTITVTNVDEMGEVTLWAGADALTMAPQVGDTITGAVMDPDGGVTGESWQWSRTMDTADMSSWMPITGATDAAYMVTAGDTGYHLRVMATYTDAAGTDMAMEDSPATMMVTAMMTVPMFDSETATREVAENTEASMDIGDPVMGTDADGDTLIYALGGTDAGSFYIDPETGQLKTLAALDYETKATYSVMVTATDPDSASDMITVTITVTNVDEMGEVTLWAGADALTMAPQVGDTITGAVMDPDGNPGVTGESWQWSRTTTPAMMESWMPITGATGAAYMVTAGDTDYYLRVMATYTDAAGTDMAMEDSPATMMVTAMMTVPMFDSETATREVAENTEASMDIGDPVMGTDADGDTLIYALGGTDAGSFYIDPETGQLKTLAALDYETKATYSVMVTATDPDSASDMITVTITVTNVDEPGMVTLWAGEDPLTMAPQVGDTITGAVMDPDGNPGDMLPIAMDTTINDVTWQWYRTTTPAMMESWMPITGATDAAYMVTAGDTDYYLRVMATYTDAAGTDMAMEDSPATMMVTAMMTVPMFDSETATREVAENTEASMDIGAPVMGTDADGDTLIYALGGTDAGSFYIDPETGQLKTLAALDYETKATYSVMVTATDPDSASDMITVTVTVTNVDEPGMVTLWASPTEELTMAPQVGETITGLVVDPDGGVTGQMWQWSRTMDTADMMASWMDIDGATEAAYMVMEGDTGYHLRVMATYTDAAGTDAAMVYSMPTMMVTAVDETQPADFDPLAKYDADKDGVLDKDEVIQAINDYLFGVGADAISKDDVIETINLYLFG